MAKELGIIETLALIKAGYTKKEIKAMADAIEEINVKDDAVEKLPDNMPKESTEPEAEKTKEEIPAASDPEPDYKQMFEELQKKYDDATSKLKAAQEANISKDVSMNTPEKVTAQQTVDKIFAEILY